MAQKSFFLNMALCLTAILTFTAAFQLSNTPNQFNQPLIFKKEIPSEDCKNAFIYQYIKNFALPLKDVEKLLTNQFSRISMSDIQVPKKVKLFDIVAVSKLLSNDQTESYPGPLKAVVFNSQIEFTVTYKLNITQGTLRKNHTFDVVTKISNISISYEKEFKLDTGVFMINIATVKIDHNGMASTFKPAPSDSEEKIFDVAIKGDSPSLLSEFSKVFSNEIVKQSMQTNCKGDHLSKIYPENPYNYKFYDSKIPIDLSTITYSSKETSLTSGMIGKLPQNNSVCSQFVPDFTDTGASLYFAKEFIQNFVQYNIATYPGWKNINVNKTASTTKMLQWQLLDLDFIVDGLWNDLGDFYQNEIRFTCDIQSQVSTNFQVQNNRLFQVMAWKCQGFVKINSTIPEWKVMDFVLRINHKLDLKISDGYIMMYVNQLEMIDCQFNDAVSLDGQGKYTVGSNGAKIAWKYIQSVFNDFRIYPIGNWFKVNSNANAVKVEAAGNGLWVI